MADNDPVVVLEENELESLGKFKILRRLATGGMGDVYVAALTGPHGFAKRLVLKLLRAQFLDKPEYLRMFQQEARVAARLNHPTIVQLFEYGVEEGIPYLAMELVEGASLDALIRRAARLGKPLGPELAAFIGVHVCDALDFAHNAADENGKPLGVVHRDVSPGNILLSMAGAVKLTDFGIAKMTTQGADELQQETQAGVIKGKYGYMAPEQARGIALDPRADLFALGVVLYEVAVGTRLFKRANEAETLLALLTAEIPRPTDLIPDFPPEFEAFLSRVLSRDREKRFASAAEMRIALEGVVAARRWTFGPRDIRQRIVDLFPESSPSMQGGAPTPSGSGERARVSQMPVILSDTWEPVAAEGGSKSMLTMSDLRAKWPYAVLGVAATVLFWWWVLSS